MHEFVCGILFTSYPTGHLAMVTLIKVVQMFIFVDNFNQVILKCLQVCSTMANKSRRVLEVSVRFYLYTHLCTDTSERNTASNTVSDSWRLILSVEIEWKMKQTLDITVMDAFPKRNCLSCTDLLICSNSLQLRQFQGRIVSHQAAKLIFFIIPAFRLK